MTKAKALKIMLQIIEECTKHDSANGGGGCRECAFGYGNRCLASEGNDIPSTWLINEEIYEWMRGAKERQEKKQKSILRPLPNLPLMQDTTRT